MNDLRPVVTCLWTTDSAVKNEMEKLIIEEYPVYVFMHACLYVCVSACVCIYTHTHYLPVRQSIQETQPGESVSLL